FLRLLAVVHAEPLAWLQHRDVDPEVREALLALEGAVRTERPFVLPAGLACVHDEPPVAVDDEPVPTGAHRSLRHTASFTHPTDTTRRSLRDHSGTPGRVNRSLPPGRWIAMAYTVKALDESTWPAFAKLVEANNGVFGGCWCMGFHEKPATAASNRRRKRARVKAGTTHAALVFDGEDC